MALFRVSTLFFFSPTAPPCALFASSFIYICIRRGLQLFFFLFIYSSRGLSPPAPVLAGLKLPFFRRRDGLFYEKDDRCFFIPYFHLAVFLSHLSWHQKSRHLRANFETFVQFFIRFLCTNFPNFRGKKSCLQAAMIFGILRDLMTKKKRKNEEFFFFLIGFFSSEKKFCGQKKWEDQQPIHIFDKL